VAASVVTVAVARNNTERRPSGRRPHTPEDAMAVIWICPSCGDRCDAPHRPSGTVTWLCCWCVPSSCCGKVPFATETAALAALARCARHARRERRAYWSPECRAWHLTSVPVPPPPRDLHDRAGWLRAALDEEAPHRAAPQTTRSMT
jgi:hypothetical protein